MTPRFSAAELAALLELDPPTAEQASVIEAPLDPAVVVAGAGSGKTETMSARVVWLVANGLVRPEQVLGLTFTRKAAGELAHRIRQRLGQLRERAVLDERHRAELLAGEPTVSTYHAYASRIVGEHGLRLAVEPSSRLLPEAVTWQLADRVVRGYGGDMTHVDRAPATVTAAVLALSGELAEHLVTADELHAWTTRLRAVIETRPRAHGQKTRNDVYAKVAQLLHVQQARLELLPLVEAYQQLKRSGEAMDFGDQMSLAARLAQRFAEVGRLERQRYAVVLLDEYQDTGHSQRVLLQSVYGRGHPVMAVGDPCQSIYGWRGASAGNLGRFSQHFVTAAGAPGGRYALTTSWRNGERILDLANALSAPLRAQGVDVAVLQAGPSGRGRGQVSCALHDTVEAEAEWIGEQVAACWGENGARAARGERQLTVAVLARKRAQFEPIEAALHRRGVPVEVVGLGGLLMTPEVSDIVATLRVLSDPRAGDALVRLLTGARWRLGPRDLAALGRRARTLAQRSHAAAYDEPGPEPAETPRAPDPGASEPLPPEPGMSEPGMPEPLPEPDEADDASLIDALDDLGPADAYSPAGYDRLRRLRGELRALRGRLGQPLPDLVADVERTLGLDVEVAAGSPHDPGDARVHLDRFLDVAAEFAAVAEAVSLPAFLAYLAAAETQERGLEPGTIEVAEHRVQLLTVHGAKGLEWDVVVVPGLAAGVFPDGKSGGDWTTSMSTLPYALRGDVADLPAFDPAQAADQKELDTQREALRQACRERELVEERRLMYVAATRAKQLLLCSGYWWDTAKKPRGASPFLIEIRDYCSAGGGDVAVWAEPPDEAAENPLTAEARARSWPIDPLGPRRARIEAGARLVLDAVEAPPAEQAAAPSPWGQEVDLLLAERDLLRRAPHRRVELPQHLSVSRLVALRRDPGELARQIRRPLPVKPAPLARRGTAFHAWVERRFGGVRLLDLDELPGAADDDAAPDADLQLLQQRFLASEWAQRQAAEVEVPFETQVEGLVLRGRMDAVFVDADGCWDVIDWKTGHAPTGAEAAAAAVQLAAYRLAWADLRGVPVHRVRAGFHYVRSNRTVRPSDLLDRDGLAALVRSVPVD